MYSAERTTSRCYRLERGREDYEDEQAIKRYKPHLRDQWIIAVRSSWCQPLAKLNHKA